MGLAHSERLAQAFGVELAHEGIELGPLLQTLETGRAGCLPSSGQVHALVAAVLLRMAGLDALDGGCPAAATRPRGERDCRGRWA